MFVEVGIRRAPGACAYPDVCWGGHTQGPQALVLALSVDDSRLKELSQVGHQHAQIKRVVNAAAIDGKLIQAMNKIPREIFACGQKTLLCHVDDNNNNCICNEPNPSVTKHAWGSKCYTWNITQPNLIMHDVSQSFPPPSWHPHTHTYAHHPRTQSQNLSLPPLSPSLPTPKKILQINSSLQLFWGIATAGKYSKTKSPHYLSAYESLS